MKLFELYAELGLDSSGFERGVNKASGMGKTLASSLRSGIGGAAGYVGQQVSATTIMMGHLMADAAKAAANAGKQMVSVGVEYNSQMEKYQTNFKTMLDGSAEAAASLTGELETMAAKTPFAMTDLADATQTLLQFGQDSETVINTLQSLGDISMGDSQKLQSLTLAFAQASSSGKLMGQDLLQMINAGFNPLLTISEQTGASMGDLKAFMSDGKATSALRKQMREAQKEVRLFGDEASDGAKMLVQMSKEGAISADLLGQVFALETSPGGRFYGAMEAASKTFDGLVSTFQDDSSRLLGKVFKPMSDWMKDDLLPKGIDLIGVMERAFDAEGLAGAVKAGSALISEYFGGWGQMALDAGASLLANVLTGITGDTVSAEKIKSELEKVWNDAEKSVNAFVSAGASVFEGIVNGLAGDKDNKDSIAQDLEKIWTDATEAVGGFTAAGSAVFSQIVASLAGDTESKNELEENLKAVFSNAGLAISDFVTAGGNVFEGILNGLTGDADNKRSIDEDIKALWDGASKHAQSFIDAGSGVLSGILKGLTGDTDSEADIVEEVTGWVGTANETVTGFINAAGGLLGTIYEQLTGQEATAENIGKTIGGVFNAGGTAVNDLLTTASTFFVDLDEKLGAPDASIGKKISGIFEAGSIAMISLLNDAGSFMSRLYAALTGDEEGAANIQKWIDTLFATPEEVEARNAASGAKHGFASPTELLNRVQSMYASPYEYGITESQADEWLTILAHGMSHESFQETAEAVMEAWGRKNQEENGGGGGGGFSGENGFKADEKSTKSVADAADEVAKAAAVLSETVAGVPVAAAAALNGAKVVLDGQEVGELLLPYISNGIARGASDLRFETSVARR